MRRIILNIGDLVVSREPSILETVLGSCVSVCLWDAHLRIGGMNHFMLPRMMEGIRDSSYCGAESTEKLIISILEMGGSISNIMAKIFGGGRVIKVFESLDVGSQNVMVAKGLLRRYGIPLISEYTGDKYATKVIFYSATGRVYVRRIKTDTTAIILDGSERYSQRGEMRW